MLQAPGSRLSEYEKNRCDDSQARTAVAKTPLLKGPLRGGAFFVRHLVARCRI
jgi:hypothetical protein